jgi:hypothetical protein
VTSDAPELTPRAALHSHLEQEDYIGCDRQGRRNGHELKKKFSLHHEIAGDITLSDFLDLFQ